MPTQVFETVSACHRRKIVLKILVSIKEKLYRGYAPLSITNLFEGSIKNEADAECTHEIGERTKKQYPTKLFNVNYIWGFKHVERRNSKHRSG